ncbi:MAG: DUF1232 domain-containing protein [Bacteroidetes bacterium]|nr:DUF1232 domain-containing protein [Bacteroidota bacterium]
MAPNLPNETTFEEILAANTKDYSGEHEMFIKNALPLYKLCNNLLQSDRITNDNRLRLFAAIGYFVIPDDIYPEDEYGPIGYIEDVLFALYVAKSIMSEHGFDILESNWIGDVNLLKQLIGTDYDDLKEEFKNTLKEVIDFTGVS